VNVAIDDSPPPSQPNQAHGLPDPVPHFTGLPTTPRQSPPRRGATSISSHQASDPTRVYQPSTDQRLEGLEMFRDEISTEDQQRAAILASQQPPPQPLSQQTPPKSQSSGNSGDHDTKLHRAKELLQTTDNELQKARDEGSELQKASDTAHDAALKAKEKAVAAKDRSTQHSEHIACLELRRSEEVKAVDVIKAEAFAKVDDEIAEARQRIAEDERRLAEALEKKESIAQDLV